MSEPKTSSTGIIVGAFVSMCISMFSYFLTWFSIKHPTIPHLVKEFRGIDFPDGELLFIATIVSLITIGVNMIRDLTQKAHSIIFAIFALLSSSALVYGIWTKIAGLQKIKMATTDLMNGKLNSLVSADLGIYIAILTAGFAAICTLIFLITCDTKTQS